MAKSRIDARINEFESVIKAKATSYARRADDVEDFQQIGRLAVFKALQDDPKATKAYINQRIDWDMLSYITRSIYKNPEESSADEQFGHILWGEFLPEEE
jgi:DNA-directed RNA polymerase specialized sigma subunit